MLQHLKCACCARVDGCRREKARSKQLSDGSDASIATAEVEANVVHAHDVDDHEGVVERGSWTVTGFRGCVTKLDAEAQILQGLGDEMGSVKLLNSPCEEDEFRETHTQHTSVRWR